MLTDEIQRIEDDLATMRQAVKKDKPYERADIFPHLALGVGALISGALISGALITIPMLQSRIDSRLCVLLGMAPGPVSYTHLPSPRDRQKSRMPSSA